MIKKVLSILFFSLSLASAKASASDFSTVQDSTNRGIEISTFLENKYNPFSVAYLSGVGYTSTKRIEVDIIYPFYDLTLGSNEKRARRKLMIILLEV